MRRVVERDEAVGRYMVLMVSAVQQSPPSIDLSDGWYAIRAGVDAPLSALIRKGSISVGTKLAICGAELAGAEAGSGTHPLDMDVNQCHSQFTWPLLEGDAASGHEPTKSVTQLTLTIHYNSTRPARCVSPGKRTSVCQAPNTACS